MPVLASCAAGRPRQGSLEGHVQSACPRKESKVAEQYEGYCVKCRTKRLFQGEKRELPNKRWAAQGPCPVCGTKITRMLGKSG